MRVFVCSRFAEWLTKNGLKVTVAENVERAQRLGRYTVLKGHSPYVPHLYLPQSLDDKSPRERQLGIKAAKEFLAICEVIWVDTAKGISEGMLEEIRHAQAIGIRIDYLAFDGLDELLPIKKLEAHDGKQEETRTNRGNTKKRERLLPNSKATTRTDRPKGVEGATRSRVHS